ncbi:unnamed protein product [Kuraishia capsulata CBS 1993]|uniref:Uncharacterized protein n=1 Tax=Kuraishia capsulata CBS 1993 TaxID=1382522 RepID=W6MIR6_9ASCO|nr:unnamed protein product [Kuraishia capsulata CBS 1993]
MANSPSRLWFRCQTNR